MKKKNKIKIRINGKYMFISSKTTAHNLIDLLKMPIDKIAIEINEEILDKKKLKKTTLKDKDKIEIVHFIGGG